MDTPDLWKLALLALCLVLSGFFSASETAFIALPKMRLMHLVRIGRPGANRVSRLVQRPEKLLAVVLLSNNLVNTAAAALATALTISVVDNVDVAVLVSTLGVTLFLLIFGETLPKTIAWNRSEVVAFAMSRPLILVGWMLSPAVRLLQAISSMVTRSLGITGVPHQVGEDEIRTMIEISAQAGEVEASEAAMLEKVFRFGDRRVQEIMTPRPEIVWVEQGTTLSEFLEIYSERCHTRFPVYSGSPVNSGSMQNIVGVLAIKDVLLALGTERLQPHDNVTALARPALFVPETRPVSNTFAEMQQGAHGMALAVDEFGSIAGLATLKQLLEVIVGEVTDEGEIPEEDYIHVDERTFRLDAGVGISEINEKLDLGLPLGDYQTVAGFILDRLGRIPEVGEVLEHQDLTFTVHVMDGVRIEQVVVQRRPAEPAGAEREVRL